MIKKTLYFGNPAYLSYGMGQLVIRFPDSQGYDMASNQNTIPVEDIGIVVLDNPQITLTHALLVRLLENNVAVISCDDSHLPTGLWWPMEGHTTQQERFRAQIESSQPLRKQLWQQTVSAKVRNQGELLRQRGKSGEHLIRMAKEVRSGDPENLEARAAAYYWRQLFLGQELNFTRDREGVFPNSWLNYGYAILRGIVARALVGAGLLPTLGIHHHNRYNAYALADDMMEPFRPMVDGLVLDIMAILAPEQELSKEVKRRLLGIPVLDVRMDGEKSPLMNAAQRMSASLARCYEGKIRQLLLPDWA